VSVLDISATALLKAKERLKNTAPRVRWIEGDITKIKLESNHYDLWHDRAVFHFLTELQDRQAYIEMASRSIKDQGFLIVATFAPQGPKRCSGLDVERYSPAELADQFRDFRLLDARAEEHATPAGTMQSFTYVLMQKAGASND
jgi:ubiquinone/menaquinone biosynthesis C-methylase UbiE